MKFDVYTDAERMNLAGDLWKHARSESLTDDETVDRLGTFVESADLIEQMGGDAAVRGLSADEYAAKAYWALAERESAVAASVDERRKRTERIFGALFLVNWAHESYQKVVTTHTYAAALMCTTATRESIGELALPWKAFVVAVPNGLVAVRGREIDRVSVGVLNVSGAVRVFFEAYSTRGGASLMSDATALDSLFYPDDARLSHPSEDVTDIERAMVLLRRLVAGLVIALQSPENVRYSESPPGKGIRGQRGRSSPSHRVAFVGRALRVDARSEVRRFLLGHRSAPPSVQSLVRGHYKRQVIGVARGGRKVVWIEPYWRGPEDAPILTRPRLVRGSE